MKTYITLLLVLTVFNRCSHEEAQTHKEEAPPGNQITFTDEQMKFIQIDTVRQVPAIDQFTAVGEVSFDENNVVRVFSVVSGSVASVSVSLGDYVHRGQILATILSTDISSYQRDFSVATANLKLAEANLARAIELYKSGMLSEREYSETQKEFSNSQSEYNSKKQILELYGGSEKELDAMFRVVAPRSGYIVERNINEGTQIRNDNGTNIFTISDLETVWVWASVHESDLSKVHEGDLVTVRTIAYPDRVFSGTIKKIGTMLDPQSRVIRVRTELNNKDGLLKPEMFANITITPKHYATVTAVSGASIVLEANNYFVMKMVGKNTFEKVMVEPGKNYEQFTEIRQGVGVGDLVVGEGSLLTLTSFNLKK